jgi:hypothetical protein
MKVPFFWHCVLKIDKFRGKLYILKQGRQLADTVFSQRNRDKTSFRLVLFAR